MKPLLDIQGVYKRFGGVTALENTSLRVEAGQIHGLIGPNGAGKTTLFNVMTGQYQADQGSFLLDGRPYRPAAVDHVARAGIARTFQNIKLFNAMTALENVMVARHARTHSGLWSALIRPPAARREEGETRTKAYSLLDYVGLTPCAEQRADTLSYGHQRRLEIARALATEPRLLALDEPAAGMNAAEKIALGLLLRRIRDDGHTILLIEHDVKLVMSLCDQISVLDYGRMLVCGSPATIRHHPDVISAYLGARDHA